MAEGGEGGEGPGSDKYPFGEYIGARDENLDRHGYGSALLPNGDIYEGNYRLGKRHGKGMYCFRNGARYEGEWRKGLKHGFGTFCYPDATKYVGQWRKDNKHGHGIYYYLNGDVYEGAWYKGWRHGLGTYSYIKEKVQHYGVWKNGRMEGAGIITYPCDFRYHGYFKRNLPIGPGLFSFEEKWIQFGFYVNMRDPAFDYLGAENLIVEQESSDQEVTQETVEEDRASPPGIVPIWRARHTVPYSQDLIPPDPVAVPIKDSEDSLLDIIDYLKQQYDSGGKKTQEGDEHENYDEEQRRRFEIHSQGDLEGPVRPGPSNSPISDYNERESQGEAVGDEYEAGDASRVSFGGAGEE
ncbi:radial spoke head 1 homolog isoform X2 [Atheta coriaria]|uniref:radial spoke head 1 homolog isoform X2 n=1 Tax=Dalotia coriaria TaxID=877792 RepID=UPI0031F441D9